MQRIHKIFSLLIILSLVCGFGLGTVLAQTPLPTTYLMAGSLTESADYLLFTDGTNYFAKNGASGKIEYTDTDIGALVQTCADVIGSDGGIIEIKAGEYEQYTTISLNVTHENLCIRGEGYKTQTIFDLQDNIRAFEIIGTSSVSPADHITIEYLKLTRTGLSYYSAIFLQYVGGCKFSNLAIDNFGYGIFADTGATPNLITQCNFEKINVYQPVYEGIVLQDTYDNRLTDIYVLDADGSYVLSYAGIKLIHSYGGDILDRCLALNGDGHGISIVENSVWVHLQSCIADNNEGTNIFLFEAMGIELVNCWGGSSQNDNTYGLDIDTCNDTIVNNCQFRTNGSHGVYILDSDRIQLNNVLCSTNGQEATAGAGISLVNSNHCIISNTICDNRDTGGGFDSTAQKKGIDEAGTSNYNIIGGCNTYDSTTSGITIDGANTKVYESYNKTAWIGGT